MQTTFLTKDWYDNLLEEVRKLKEESLPIILERLKEAISQWDISENAEYDSAMSERELAEARIAEIEMIVQNVEIIDETQVKGWEIRYGSQVTVTDAKWRANTWRIVGSGEVNVLTNTISFQSPMGAALRGKKEGDKVQVRAPNKRYEVTISKVA